MSLSRNWNCKSIGDECWEFVHPWDKSCCKTAVGIWLIMHPHCVRLYLPFFLASDLAKYGFDVKRIMSHTLRNTICSSAFLTFQGTMFFPISCLLRKLLGCYYTYTIALVPMFCSAFLGLLMEQKERRLPLASYACTEAIYGLYYSLKSKGLVKSLPNGEVILFSLALSLLCQSMEHHGKDLSISLLRFLLNPYISPLSMDQYHTTALSYYPKAAFILSVAETCCWSFLIGYCGRSLSSMVTGLLKGKNYSHLIKPWLYRNNVQLGYFLATMTGVYKLSFAVFRQFLPLSKASLLAGALAGLSMLLYRSPFTALYIAIKATEILYGKIVKAGYMPSVHRANVLIYAVATVIVIHLGVCEPDHISKQYWSFIINISRGRLSDFNVQKLPYLGIKPFKRHAKPDIALGDHQQQHSGT